MMNSASTMTKRSTLSGRKIVVAMFVFASSLVFGMWVYWKLHVAPFVPLQRALTENFGRSEPYVEGGQRKIHKNTSKMLRVTMRVDFDPTQPTKTRDEFIDEVAAFVQTQHDLSQYVEFELHLFRLEPKKEIQKEVFKLMDNTKKH